MNIRQELEQQLRRRRHDDAVEMLCAEVWKPNGFERPGLRELARTLDEVRGNLLDVPARQLEALLRDLEELRQSVRNVQAHWLSQGDKRFANLDLDDEATLDEVVEHLLDMAAG